jgi:hypothetical protein
MVKIRPINKRRTRPPAMAVMPKKIPSLIQVCFSSYNWVDKMETLTSTAAVDEVASKEGLPAGLDPEVNNVVNDEVNKFWGSGMENTI